MRTHRIPYRIDQAIRFLFYVLIFWLPYAPAVIESCVVTACVLWIFKRGFLCYQRLSESKPSRTRFYHCLKAFRPTTTLLNRPIFFFLFFCLLAILGSHFPEQSASGFLTKTLEWFIVYFLIVEAFCEEKSIVIFLSAMMFSAMATSFDGLWQFYVTQKDLFHGHMIEEGGRITAGFKHPNFLGGYLNILVPFSFALVFVFGNKFYRLLSFALFMILGWTLFLTVSRAAWVAVFCMGAYFLLFKNKKYFALAIVVMISFAVAVYALLPLSAKQDMRISQEDISTAREWRKGLWIDSFLMITDRPFLGHGPNTYMRIFQEHQQKFPVRFVYGPTYAHNCFLQMTAEVGILGLSAFLWLLFVLFKQLSLFVKDNEAPDRWQMMTLGLLSGLLSFLIHSFFDNHFYTLQLSVYFWTLVGILIAMDNMLKRGGVHVIKEAA